MLTYHDALFARLLDDAGVDVLLVGDPLGMVPQGHSTALSVSIGADDTLGNLHEGHLSLVRVALERPGLIVASIFVNQLQFAPHEDFTTYTRTLQRDCDLLSSGECDVVKAIRPPIRQTTAILQLTAIVRVLLLSIMFTMSGLVSIGTSTNLPRLFATISASPAAAIAAASILGPAQVAARILEFSARRRINPLISARIASALHPLASLAIALGGAPLIVVFSIVHGAGNGMLTICRGTLSLALYGPEGYGARIGGIAAPARIGQATAPFLFGLAIDKLGGATLLISPAVSLAALLALSRIELPTGAAADAA